MFPLNRPQVFFLTTQTLGDKELTLTKMPEDLKDYKVQFIKEYVRERNEIVPDLAVMRAKWANNDKGAVRTRSTDAVFGKFAETDMANLVYQDLNEAFDIECRVEYPENYAVVLRPNSKDIYTVQFTYICTYGPMGDQEYKKSYTLRVKLKSTAESAIRWAERMENPLGFRVSGYEVVGNQNDPLNWSQDINR